MKHIVSFSGGKDSTAMLLMMMDRNMQIDEIIFCDTTMEFPEMYEHIDKVEKYIGRKITRIMPKHSFEYYLKDIIKIKGKYAGQAGYGWTGHMYRWCTNVLKKQPSNRYLKGIKHLLYLGIAVDEVKRFDRPENKKEHYRFPLKDWDITEKHALAYCYGKGFNWGGLYEKFSRVSCWCCPLQPLRELKVLYKDFPQLWAELKRLDKLSWRKFRSDYSVSDLEVKFDKENSTI
jgi:3'-phosphoadenosine 5'-phosphosulfate sulfotransferase (PAPS reductase)/FAD synthetase